MKTASPVAERGAVKRVVVPSRRVTEPVGVPAGGGGNMSGEGDGEPAVAVAMRLLRVTSMGAGLMVRVARVGAIA